VVQCHSSLLPTVDTRDRPAEAREAAHGDTAFRLDSSLGTTLTPHAGLSFPGGITLGSCPRTELCGRRKGATMSDRVLRERKRNAAKGTPPRGKRVRRVPPTGWTGLSLDGLPYLPDNHYAELGLTRIATEYESEVIHRTGRALVGPLGDLEVSPLLPGEDAPSLPLGESVERTARMCVVDPLMR
jgi:hypothetical protein